MSAPADRLCGDPAAERFELEARSILAAVPLLSGQMESLAVAVIVLAEDRQARIELAAAGACK
jgi:hypothetical protein